MDRIWITSTHQGSGLWFASMSEKRFSDDLTPLAPFFRPKSLYSRASKSYHPPLSMRKAAKGFVMNFCDGPIGNGEDAPLFGFEFHVPVKAFSAEKDGVELVVLYNELGVERSARVEVPFRDGESDGSSRF